MNKILSIDPSGTGTTGIFFFSKKEQVFFEITDKEWKNHLLFIIKKIKEKKPKIVIFEDTNYIHRRTKDGLSLFRLLGAIESLVVKEISKGKINSLEIKTINVLKVKKITKNLLKGEIKIDNLEYLPGRGKGWMWRESCKHTNLKQGEWKRISIHCLEAFIIYYIFKDLNREKIVKTL